MVLGKGRQMESVSRPLVAILVWAAAFAVGVGLHRRPFVSAVARFPVFLVVGGGTLVLVAVGAFVAPIRPEVGERITVALMALVLVVRLVQIGTRVGRQLGEGGLPGSGRLPRQR